MSKFTSVSNGRGLFPRTFGQVECVQWERKVAAVRVEVAVDTRLRAVVRVVCQANERVEIPMLLCHLERSRNLVVRDYVGSNEVSDLVDDVGIATSLTENLDHSWPNCQVVLSESANVRSVGVLECAVRE